LPETQTVTYLFSDIEGSTRLWETDPDGAARALAWHDRLSRDVVGRHHGVVVKMTGDGMHAAFAEPAAAVDAVIELQTALARTSEGVPALKVRCGLHLGADQRRDNDFYGPAVNRAARISGAAHGGQVLLSGAVAEQVRGTLPPGAGLRELGLVRLKDLASPERVFQLTHPALRAEFPALRSLESAPNNLPQQLNSFVGREREMDEVRGLLPRSRLVTLLAMGGVGKSRLSIQLGAEVLEDYPDGVWLVELAPLANAADVPQAVASVLGVKEDQGSGLMEALGRFVRDRRMLLILDNCEHVVHGVADLAKKLLQASATLKVLASSRDPLHIAGETVYHLPTLAVPRPGEVRPEELAPLASVRLFLDRALAANPGFQWTGKHAAPVADICRRLDGIPLALELAAARTRALPVDVIAARLDERFRLLTTGDRTVLPRQQTLRALIDWSFDLLDERERVVFRRLAVFAGGWTLEAAEMVVGGDGVDPHEVVVLLGALVEKSLVLMEADSGRYRMLDTVRHYAKEKLAESGEPRPAQERHVTHFLRLAERAQAALRTSEQSASLRDLDADRENVLAAFAYAVRTEHGSSQAFKLMIALRFYLIHRGLPSVILSMCEELLTRPELAKQPLLHCRTLSGAGQACSFMGRHSSARRYLHDALAIARELEDSKRVAAILQPLAAALMGEHDYDGARVCLDEAVALAKSGGDEYEEIAALTVRGMLHRLEGEGAQAEAIYRAVLGMARKSGHKESIVMSLLNLAMTLIPNGPQPECPALLTEALAIADETQSLQAQQSALEVCAGLAVAEGRWETAGRLFGYCESQAERTALRRDPADEAFYQAAIARARAQAATETAMGEASGRTLSADEALRDARSVLLPAASATSR
jgi:predicted ATPase/class 3 adenylate cyclase